MRRVLCAVVLASCGGEPPDPGATDGTAPATTDPTPPPGTTPTGNYTDEATTDGGRWDVVYSSDPDPIPLNEYFSVTVTVGEAGDPTVPAAGAAVSVDAGMPEHGHGMNVAPTITDNGDGTWTADPLLFHMEGHWQITVSVTDAVGLETAYFDTECCQ